MRRLFKISIVLKTKVLQNIFLLVIGLALVSFSDPYSVKRISDKEFRYEFYTTQKTITPKINKNYFWFKGGIIHTATAGIAGELLHGGFLKMYHSNQLAEQGEFKKGLKKGLWKTWYENGNLSSIGTYTLGLKSGKFTYFSTTGEVVEKGKYKNDKKTGIWINYLKKDTTFYKNGNLFTKTKKSKKSKQEKSQSPKSDLKNSEPSKKESFFKRLFGKKNKNDKGA